MHFFSLLKALSITTLALSVFAAPLSEATGSDLEILERDVVPFDVNIRLERRVGRSYQCDFCKKKFLTWNLMGKHKCPKRPVITPANDLYW
ncbi:hypothetical protein C8J56DRAFT_969094 [Mycena floridula]|nr:hypothetical protein C8J56DRAFT_969094 [Mycena floridula]